MRAGGTCKASFGEILKFFNSPPKLSPNRHKLVCVTERLNPCSLHRHSISQARQTQRDKSLVSRFAQNTGFVSLGSSMLLFILMRLIFTKSLIYRVLYLVLEWQVLLQCRLHWPEVSLLAPHWLPKEEYNKIMCMYTWRLIQPCFFCLVQTFWLFHSEWILRCYNSSGRFWRNFLLVFFTLGLYKKKSESVGEFSNFGHCEPGNLSKGRTPPCVWQRRRTSTGSRLFTFLSSGFAKIFS